MKKIISQALCFLIVWTSTVPSYASTPVITSQHGETGIVAGQPNARIIHVSPEEYPALELQLSKKGYRQSSERIVIAEQYERYPAERTQVIDTDNGVRNDCNESTPPHDSGDSSVFVGIDIVNDLTPSGDGLGETIVFVVIGAVVVIVWTLYVFKYLYDVSVGVQPCGRWSELTVSASSISNSSYESADFTGVHFMTGYRDGYTDIGLSAEAGYSDIRLNEASSLNLDGVYWLVGPILRWRLDHSNNPSHYEMEFLAGTTEHREVGLLAKAKAGFSFGIGDGFRLGVNLGVLNINLNDNQGIITDRSRYYYLLGMEMGYRF